MSTNNIKPYSKAIVKLLKGIVERQDALWNDIIQYKAEIQDYISVIGLELIVKKEEGFAYLKQMKLDDDKTVNLVSRRKLTFEVSVVLIVLRQLLEEFDSDPMESQSNDRFVTTTKIREEVELFLPEKFNRVKFMNEINGYIDKVVQLGYLVVSKQNATESLYKIHRIIKEKITLDDLIEFKNKLNQYAADDESI